MPKLITQSFDISYLFQTACPLLTCRKSCVLCDIKQGLHDSPAAPKKRRKRRRKINQKPRICPLITDKEAAAEQAAADQAAVQPSANKAATGKKTYSAQPLKGAIVTYINQSTGQFGYKEQCVNCGAIQDYDGVRKADGTTITVSFTCHKCGKSQDAIIETRVI